MNINITLPLHLIFATIYAVLAVLTVVVEFTIGVEEGPGAFAFFGVLAAFFGLTAYLLTLVTP